MVEAHKSLLGDHTPLQSPGKITDWVTIRLRDAIVGGRLQPGSPLGLVALADELGVSTTPVREALQRLREEGVVTGNARRTFRVAELTLADISDFHWLHASVSAELAVRASLLLTAEDFEQLESIDRAINRALETADHYSMHEMNFAFHRLINRTAPRSVLHRQVTVTSRYVSRRTYPDVPGWLEGAAQEHRAIIDALRSVNEADIRATVTEHIVLGGERLTADLRATGGWPEFRADDARSNANRIPRGVDAVSLSNTS